MQMLEKDDLSNGQKMNGYSFQQVLAQNLSFWGIFKIALFWEICMFSYFNFETNLSKKLFQKTGVPLLSWDYYDLKRKISIQNCPVRSQC